jgi:hypothetical protein
MTAIARKDATQRIFMEDGRHHILLIFDRQEKIRGLRILFSTRRRKAICRAISCANATDWKNRERPAAGPVAFTGESFTACRGQSFSKRRASTFEGPFKTRARPLSILYRTSRASCRLTR